MHGGPYLCVGFAAAPGKSGLVAVGARIHCNRQPLLQECIVQGKRQVPVTPVSSVATLGGALAVQGGGAAGGRAGVVLAPLRPQQVLALVLQQSGAVIDGTASNKDLNIW